MPGEIGAEFNAWYFFVPVPFLLNPESLEDHSSLLNPKKRNPEDDLNKRNIRNHNAKERFANLYLVLAL